MPALSPALLLCAAAALAEPAALTPLRPMTDFRAGQVAFVANGPLAVREYRLGKPPRLVIEFDGARVVGQPLRIPADNGGPIRAGGVYQVGPDLARAVFMLDDPTRLALRIEPLGPRHTRFVIAPLATAQAAPRAAAGRIDGLAWQGGYLKVHGSRPLVARVSPLADAPGYVLEFAGTRLADELAAFAVEPGGEVRRVRALRPSGGHARVEIELARPAAYKLRQVAGEWLWGPVKELQRLPLAAGRLPRALSWRPGTAHAAAWREGSHFLVTSNASQFGPGPLLVGTRHRYGGHFVQAWPAVAGTLVGHLDAQLLRFTEPRFDYVNTLGSLALAHPLWPGVHLFEGAAALQRKEAYASTVNMLDGSLFAGLGFVGGLPGGGSWATSMLADRVSATDVRRAYYGQAARLRGLVPVGWGLVVTGQATLQRLDPLVRSQPFFREYLDLSLEATLWPGSRLGLLAQAGLQQRLGQAEAYVLGGPTFQLVF